MAAHIKTGIEQVLTDIEKGQLDKSKIEGAVNLDCFTADDYHVWEALFMWTEDKINTPVLAYMLQEHLARITKIWDDLGQPATREEWWQKRKERGY